MGKIKHKEMGFLLHAPDDHQGLAKIRLRIARRMRQRDEHLLQALLPFAHIVLDDRVAAGKFAFIAQAVEYVPGRVPLLARHLQIVIQPLIDGGDKRIQLGAPDGRPALIARRRRKRQHLGHAVPRYVEMLRRLAPTHPFRHRQPNPQIQVHGVDPLTLLLSWQKSSRWPDFTPPATGLFRRYRGRLLRRRSQV